MFSMSAAGLAKTLVAVTISMHPAAAHHASHDQYKVRPAARVSAPAPPRVRKGVRLARGVVGKPPRGTQPGPDHGRPAAAAAEPSPGEAVADPGRAGHCPGARAGSGRGDHERTLERIV